MHPPGNRVLRRLDRIYFSQGGVGPSGVCSSTILPGFAFSDHAPVRPTLTFVPPPNRPSRFRMNTSHFDNPTYKDRIVAMWAPVDLKGTASGWSPSVILQQCIKGARLIDRCWGKRKAKERGLRLVGLQARVAEARERHSWSSKLILIMLIPNCRLVQLTKEALLTFCATQANWVELVMQSRWLMEGDRGTKLFYKSFKGLAAGKEIHELLAADGTPDGIVKSLWEDLAGLATDFFANILGILRTLLLHRLLHC